MSASCCQNGVAKPSIETALLDAGKAAVFLSISRRHFLNLHESGSLGPLPRRLGKRVLWSKVELLDWIAAGCPNRDVWANRGR